MKVFRTTVIVFASALAVALLGCGGGSDKPPDTGGAMLKGKKTEKDRVIVTLITAGNNDFWRLVVKGAEQASTELPNVGFDPKVMSVEPNAQYRMMKYMVDGQKVDAVIIAPGVPSVMEEWLTEYAKKTILLTLDSDVPRSKRLLYVGTNHYAAGRAAAEAFLELVPEGGKVCLFVGKIDAPDASARFRGFKDAGETKIEILAEPYNDDGDAEICMRNVDSARVKYGSRLNGLVGLWAYNTPAIAAAVKAGGRRAEGLKIVGFEEEEITLSLIEENKVFATVVQDPFQMGYTAVKTAVALARGDESVLPQGFPQNRTIEIPFRVIKKNDVAEFRKELYGRLGRKLQ
jgi:ribose transport system substrate-binding protein